jgi:hypothetical protein
MHIGGADDCKLYCPARLLPGKGEFDVADGTGFVLRYRAPSIEQRIYPSRLGQIADLPKLKRFETNYFTLQDHTFQYPNGTRRQTPGIEFDILRRVL